MNKAEVIEWLDRMVAIRCQVDEITKNIPECEGIDYCASMFGFPGEILLYKCIEKVAETLKITLHKEPPYEYNGSTKQIAMFKYKGCTFHEVIDIALERNVDENSD